MPDWNAGRNAIRERAANTVRRWLVALDAPHHISHDSAASPLNGVRRVETAEERDIRRYVELETSDDMDGPVESVELVKRHRVIGQAYEIFDVRCAKSRWWVITNLTNLYSHDEFKTADYAFTFHLGLTLRMWERDRVTTDEDARAVSETAWRKYEDAVQALGEANESEGFQAVGVRLREAMIALVKDQAAEDWVADVQDRPQLANVKGWLEILVAKLTPNRRQRAYERAIWDKSWDLVVHLQHDSSATNWDAEVAVNAVAHALETYMQMKVHSQRAQTTPCPRCNSRRFGSTSDWDHQGVFVRWEECSACGYATEPQV